MDSTDSSSNRTHDDFAADYDQQVLAYGWWGHEALFGLCFEYVQPQERLLDVGIGTGLASIPFVRAGLQVFGFDSSPEMLSRCRARNIAAELKHFDLTTRPWPYPDTSFDHMIACGVLHFVADLEPVFDEAARVIRPGGIFAFTTKVPPPGTEGVFQQTIDDMAVFSHGRSTVEAVIAAHEFTAMKCLRLAAGGDEVRADWFFAFVTRKVGA